MTGITRGSTALFVAALLLVVASPLPWFEVQGFGVDASFSGIDTIALGATAVTLGVVYAIVAVLVRHTGRQAWFLLTLCLGVFCLFITLIVYVSTEVIAGALPLPEPLEDSVPGPGPGLGFVLLSAGLAMVGSIVGLLARPGRTGGLVSSSAESLPIVAPVETPPSRRPPHAPVATTRDLDIPEF